MPQYLHVAGETPRSIGSTFMVPWYACTRHGEIGTYTEALDHLYREHGVRTTQQARYDLARARKAWKEKKA